MRNAHGGHQETVSGKQPGTAPEHRLTVRDVIVATAFGAVVVAALVIPTLIAGLRATGGEFTYALDDAYIHMAIARNWVEYGVWGITRHGFSSTTSSPLWTLLLAAGYSVAGPNVWLPFALNAALGVGLVAGVVLFARSRGMGYVTSCVIAVLATLLMPLVPLVFSGMEHLLHTVLAFAFLWLAVPMLTGEKAGLIGGRFAALLVVTCAMTAARYESVLLIGVVAALFALRRDWVRAGLIVAASLVPVAVYGAISAGHGWWLLPNPVVLKGKGRTDIDAFSMYGAAYHLGRGVLRMARYPHVPALIAALGAIAVALVRRHRVVWQRTAIWTGVIAIALSLQVTVAAVDNFFRYEAYLVFVGVPVLITGALEVFAGTPKRRTSIAIGLTCVLAFATLGIRSAQAQSLTVPGMRSIHGQQVQMGRFLHDYYDNQAVLINDIGAVAWYSNVKIVDVVGLATLDAARRRLTDPAGYDAGYWRSLATRERAAIAVLYADRYRDVVPPEWTRVADWRIADRGTAAYDRVTFYAVDADEAGSLRVALEEFESRLPRNASAEYAVSVTGQ